jgi:hypothetical protein
MARATEIAGIEEPSLVAGMGGDVNFRALDVVNIHAGSASSAEYGNTAEWISAQDECPRNRAPGAAIIK